MRLTIYSPTAHHYISILSALLLILVILTGCASTTAYNPGLSDLGGVYASRDSDLKLEIEVSGRLSEGNDELAGQEDGKGELTDQAEGNVWIGEAVSGGELSNKLLRWGISRRENNQTPAADPGAPQLLEKYGGAYLGDISKSVIYLTFDEGYENGYTPLILDTLRDNHVRAVFFITGPYLKGQQELVRRMVEEGHLIGNHTIHHPSLPELENSQLEEEVLGLDRAFQEKFGQNMVFLRPPKGEYSERTLALTNDLGYCNLFWSFAYDDWYRDKIRGPEYALNMVMRNLHNGAVLLLHAVSKDNAEALDSIIKGAVQKGYTIGDPQELLPPEKAGIESMAKKSAKVKKEDISHEKRLREKFTEVLELPKELVLDLPKLTMVGNGDLMIENYRNVMEYGSARLRINIGLGVIKITGSGLLIKEITSEDIIISGEIHALEFLSNGHS